MNIVILSGSPRKGGNTEILAESFAQGASSKHNVDFISVRHYHINPCIGCNSCFKRDDQSCIQKDDMQTVYDKLAKADMLVVASPVYFYGISSQLKALIDRCHNPLRDSFKIKKVALLLVGAATLPELFDSILVQYRLCINYFHLEDCGKILVRGVKEKGDIKNTNALKEAFSLGASI